MPGIHNISNAFSASLVASYLGLSEFEINNAFSSFKGINRRFKNISIMISMFISMITHIIQMK